MSEFKKYIHSILENNGFNEASKIELECEFNDHLTMLKDEYLSKGYSEEEAVKLAIKAFGENYKISSELKDVIYYNNRCTSLDIKNTVKFLFYMFITYFFGMWLVANNLYVNRSYDPGISIVYFLTALISFICINIKVKNKTNCIKSILICNIIFLICQNLIMFCLISFRQGFFSLPNTSLVPQFYFLLFTIIFISLTYTFRNKASHKKIFVYDFNMLSIVLWSISVILISLYSLIPNKFFILRKLIVMILNDEIFDVKKNLFFILINKTLFIPNVGLLCLLILVARLLFLKYRQDSHHV